MNKFIKYFNEEIAPLAGVNQLEENKGQTSSDQELTDNFSKGGDYNCLRCNDNGCPACDGTRGSEYNPEPY